MQLLRVGARRAAGLAMLISICAAASAQAAPKEPIYEFGFAGAGAGELSQARGIAVNESGAGGVSPGSVYVVEFGNNRVQQFDADGNFVRAWGRDVVLGGGSGFEICEAPQACKAGAENGGAGGLSDASGIAVNQATGDVYVAERGNSRVEQFEATGGFVRAWGRDVSVAGGEGFEICEIASLCKAGLGGGGAGMFGFGSTVAIGGIAVDAAGAVYVADAGNARVQKFGPEGNFLTMGGWDVDATTPFEGYEACAVAADCKAGIAGGEPLVGGEASCQFGNNNLPSFLTASPAGDVYAVGGSDGSIYRLSAALACDPAFHPAAVPSGQNNRNALAFVGGNLFFTQGTSSTIFELDPATQTVVVEHPAGANEWVGLAVNAATGRIYADRTTSAASVRVLDEGLYPKAVTSAASAVSGTKATLNGTLDPEGAEPTECAFEYGTDGAYGSTVPCAESNAEIGSGTTPVAVHADLSGLAPATKYNFRLTASNPNTAKGANRSLQTSQTVVTQAASAVTGEAATLNGTVNSDGEAIAACSFEWGTTTAYGNSAPCAQSGGEIGTGTSPVAVHADLLALQPGTVYHYRLTATYAGGAEAQGADMSLQTLGAAIEATWSVDVYATEAKLRARIDPEGLATTYRFEYVSEAGFEATGFEGAARAPIPDGDVGDDSEAHVVGTALTGLAPGTTYVYRAVASNADAVNRGPAKRLTTHRAATGDGGCANEALRFGPAAQLPDCRAYELVSPVDKNGGDIRTEGAGQSVHEAYIQGTTDGSGITYSAAPSFGDQASARFQNQYLARRGTGGWSNHGINAPLGKKLGVVNELQPWMGPFSEDLCSMWLTDRNATPLLPDAQEGYANLYRRQNCAPGEGGFETLTTVPPLAPLPPGPDYVDHKRRVQGFSADLGEVLFVAAARLTSDAGLITAPQTQVYLHPAGEPAPRAPRLVSILPDGSAAVPAGTSRNSVGVAYEGEGNLENAVSADGRRVFWSQSVGSGLAGPLYVRENPAAPETTVKAGGVCVPQPAEACTTPVSLGPATFWDATPDGATAIYSEGSLSGGEATLFSYDVASRTRSELLGGVWGVAGAGTDLARIYVISGEAEGEAVAGARNLYLLEGGSLSFIATLTKADLDGVGGNPRAYNLGAADPFLRATRVSPDGDAIAFQSQGSPTGYDNTDTASGRAAVEVYLYRRGEGLACASCNPTGQRPAARELPPPYVDFGALEFDPARRTGVSAAAWIPTWENPLHASRALAEGGGRLFFNSNDALVAGDANGAQDVYQWEAPGTGGCTPGAGAYSPANGGCVELISSGQSPYEAEFWEADADGSDVFFTTLSSLVAQDPGLIDLYNARIGGGFPAPVEEAICEGEACANPPAAPQGQTPASSAYRGPGNVAASRGCGAEARKAQRLARRAKRLRRSAGRVRAPARSKQMRRKALRLAGQAKRRSQKAKRCRRANRRAGR